MLATNNQNMHPVELTDAQIERLRVANQTKKYGHLESWRELYVFQRCIATPTQTREIAEFAKRSRKGERIILPLKKMLES